MPTPNSPADAKSTRDLGGDSRTGLLYALAAYGLWGGVLPLYMKAMSGIPAVEVIANRVLWSLPVALLVLWLTKRTDDLKAALANPRLLLLAAAPATIVSINWGIYVWALGNGQALESAMGYFVNPLFSVVLGAVLLGERMKGLQYLAVAAAAIGVAILTWENGRLPLVTVGLAVTWGFYAYFKRALPLGPNQGFTLEVILLMPFALGWFIWLLVSGQSTLLTGTPMQMLLLLGTGLITAGPLMLYANGAKGLRLSTIAILQYITPTLIFLFAVFVFGEPFSQTKLVAFAFIWAALGIYSWTILRRRD